MHDIRSIRDNPKDFDKALGRRGIIAASEEILKIDEDRRSAILSAETAQAEQNKSSKLIGAAKAAGDEKGFEKLRKLVADKKTEVADMNAKACPSAGPKKIFPYFDFRLHHLEYPYQVCWAKTLKLNLVADLAL